MTEYYLLSRAGITADYITASQARELHDEAGARPEAGLEGDLESGFRFWSSETSERVRLVRCVVTPLRDHEVPADVPRTCRLAR